MSRMKRGQLKDKKVQKNDKKGQKKDRQGQVGAPWEQRQTQYEGKS